jgi:predicted nucleotidyltransferase
MASQPLELASDVAARLGKIDGVVAVVLGGSHARGAASPDSDIDLGLYYDPERRPSLDALRSLAQEIDDRHTGDAVTSYGEWGPWINGGGWLTIQGHHVDWLYRDLSRVSRAIAECTAGQVACYYQPGHPLGFYNHIYMGEVFYCRPLYERDSTLSDLKARTTPYPPLLKQAVIQRLWEAGFSLQNCPKPASRGDVVHVVGFLYRAVGVMVQALFALNERYCLNEKGSVRAVETLALRPPQFSEIVSAVMGAPGRTEPELQASIGQLQSLLAAVQALCAGA